MFQYRPPASPRQTTLQIQLRRLGYADIEAKPLSLSQNPKIRGEKTLWYAGDLEALTPRAISVVGAREVSQDGAARAHKIARQLAEAGVVVVSGLARGVDTFALTGAIKGQGRVVAVIGTPLDKATPASNATLQEDIYREHLLITQFPAGSAVKESNFPARNRTMAALSAGTLIVEASDISGTRHQAAECARLNRWLFVMKSVMLEPHLEWPSKFQKGNKRFVVVGCVEDILQRL